MSDTTLEEFLEELDALTDVDVEDQTGQDTETKLSPSSDLQSVSEEVSGSAAPVSAATLREHPEALSPRSSEKKVRFSEELIQGARTRQTAGSQDSASSESNLKASSPSSKKNKQEVQGPQQPFESAKQDNGSPQDQGDDPSAPPVAQWESYEIECTKKDSSPPTSPNSPPAEKACASPEKACLQPVELAKCNISNTNAGMKYSQWPWLLWQHIWMTCTWDTVGLFSHRGANRLWSVCPEPGVRRNPPDALYQQRQGQCERQDEGWEDQ